MRALTLRTAPITDSHLHARPERSPRRRALLAAGLATSILAGAGPAPAQTGRPGALELAKLKAAYVLNFARYTNWPEAAFADRRSPIVVGVVADEDFAVFLEALVEDETVHGRRLEVRRIEVSALDGPDDGGQRSALVGRLRELHLVFIGRTARDRMGWLLDRLEGEHVLTVSDIDDFAERGGMLGLVVRNRRLAFDANVEEIHKSRVTVSSQVLRLARIVGQRSS